MNALCVWTLLLLLLLLSAPASLANGAPRAARITEHPSDMTVARNDPVTLKCSADGNPAPVIEWYRDGELVISSSGVGGAGSAGGHRVVLPGGDLFFFRVILSRKESDAGVYWCTARNSLGASRSRNATLTVAYLHSDFRTAPAHTRGILGEPATLECEAPRGQPEPQVTWKKDGQIVDASIGRVRLEENGSLFFAKLSAEDEGRYQCVAQNAVGARETPVALLSVHVRPVIVRPPQDSVALIGGEATLECGVKGDPPPHVEWRRQDGVKIPLERVRPVEGSKTSLRLHRLVPSDSARYVCEAENSVGSSSASAQLTVLIPPSWNSSTGSGGQLLPREVRANLDQNVYIDCPVQGSPTPLIFWRRDGQGRAGSLELITSDSPRAHRRWSVFANGTLLIARVRREDGGGVWCGAVSEAGSLVARTRLDVVAVSAPPPPVIEYGPANQSLARGSEAFLACSATDPLPVRWWKDGQPLAYSDRVRFDKESGVLRIGDLRVADGGLYTCSVGKEDALSSWSASLSVANDTSEGSPISGGPVDPLALPGSPSQPRLLERTRHSLTFAWQNGSRAGSSPLLGYVVEVFTSSDDLNESWTWGAAQQQQQQQQHAWRVVERHLQDDRLTLTGLQPATSYAVLVRAENSHGLSLPSLVSPWFTTLPSNGDDADGAPEADETRSCSSAGPLLHLDAVRPLNATSARLTWRWLDSGFGDDVKSHGAGAYIFYRSVARKRNETFAPFRAEVVLRASHVSSFAVTNLVPSLRYSFFMVPFCRNSEGRPSNSLALTMPEAAPDGPPRDLYIRQLNLTSCLVKWSEPLPHQQNGVVTGYQIYVLAHEFETLLANMTLPATPTSVIIGNLVAGSTYLIRAAAWTSAGLGPPTDAASFTMQASSFPHNGPAPPADDLYNYSDEVYTGSEKNDRTDVPANIVHEKWFILAIGGVVLAILTLVVVMLFVRRYWMRNKASSVHKSEFYGNNGETEVMFSSRGSAPRELWVRERRVGNESKYTYNFAGASSEKKESDMEAQSSLLPHESRNYGMMPPPEYAELLNQNDSKIAESDHSQVSLSSFLPVHAAYDMSKPFQSQLSAYATTNLITASPREPYSQYPPSSSSSSERSKLSAELKPMSPKLRGNVELMDHQRAPNLTDFLPLPPRYPPPPNAAIFSETSEDDGSLPMPRKSPYKFNSAAPSPALSKRSAPATPSSLSSRVNRLNNTDDGKRHRHQSKASKSSFSKLEDGYPKIRGEASIDSDYSKYNYARCREVPASHAESQMDGSASSPAYEMQEAFKANADFPLRSPRCRLK